MVEDVCCSVPNLAMLAELPTIERVHRLVTEVRKTREETVKVQLELNLQIAEL